MLHINVNKSGYNAPIFKIEKPPQSRHSDAHFGVWHVYLSGMTSPTKKLFIWPTPNFHNFHPHTTYKMPGKVEILEERMK